MYEDISEPRKPLIEYWIGIEDDAGNTMVVRASGENAEDAIRRLFTSATNFLGALGESIPVYDHNQTPIGWLRRSCIRKACCPTPVEGGE